jgi:hypothetical protein
VKANRKYGLLIHMGASTFTVSVRKSNDEVVTWDINRMNQKERRNFTKELCIAFREAHQ